MRLTVPMLLISSLAFAGDRYEVADLQALEAQGAWSELVDHLADVLPSKRNAEWQKIAESASVGLLSENRSTDQDPLSNITLADKLAKAFPGLRKSKAFMAKRAEMGILDLQLCRDVRSCRGQADADWTQRIYAFARTDPQNIAVPAANMEMNSLIADVTVPLYDLALAGKSNVPLCKDAGLKKAVISALKDNNWNVDAARQIASTQCFQDLKADLLTAIDAPKQEDLLKTSCDFLTKAGVLSPEQTTKCAPFAKYKEKNRTTSVQFSTTPER